MRTIILILLINANCNADTVIIIPSQNNNNYTVPSMAEQMNSMIQGHNWNIQRNAAINDALKYENLKPPVKIEIDKYYYGNANRDQDLVNELLQFKNLEVNKK